ncbi:MAG: acetolactate synthase large subunit, partial [Dysgonamonadaceae bacterium]|nr:acetolactate synthase large subunit [Dysgonamonadaceae bacterium]
DFVKIAAAYRIPGRTVETREELDRAIREMLETKGAYLLEVKVVRKGMVYPMVPAGGCVTDILLGEKSSAIA